MKAAVATKQFGVVLAAYRAAHEPEVTQSEVAQWLGITQSQVSRIERQTTPVNDLRKLDRWATALGIPQRYLWFSLSPNARDAYESDSRRPTLRAEINDEDGDVQRRQFMKKIGLGATAVGAFVLTSELAADPPGYAPTEPERSRDDVEVDSVRAMTQTFRRLDNMYGGGHSQSAVSGYLTSTIEPIMRDGRPNSSARSELFSAVAELYQLAGWMAYDTGQAGVGRQHMRKALQLSKRARNPALSAEMLAGMSHHAAFHGKPDDAVELAMAAGELAERTGIRRLSAEAAVMEAHGFALQGEGSDCLAALSTAEKEFEKSSDDVPDWLGYFDGAYLSAKFAHAFRDLGQLRDAEVFARRSLEMSDRYKRGRLFNTALLASILADQRRVDEAAALGMEAVGMAGTVRSVRGAAYLADVAARLGKFSASPRVADLYRAMIDAGVPVPRG
jgi:transcriptional regulator with XRE-family HTH domain/tetratricopeptide (TPR) repeat protein